MVLMTRRKPVSYTHLDVYKRQNYFSMVGSSPTNPIEMDWNATTLYFTIRGSWNTQRFRNPIRIYSLFTFNGQGRSVWVTNPAGHIDGNGNYFFNRGYYGGGGPEYQWINGESEWDQLNLGADVNGVAQPGGPSELVTFGAKDVYKRQINVPCFYYTLT